MYMLNAWYVAAWPREIDAAPLSRMICEEPVVLFRKSDGSVAALEDRCCHRHLPLSMGKIENDCLRCGYHGLLFDAEGMCVEIPVQRDIPKNARVRSFPVVEKWQMVWIWMGDPSEADPAKIPNIWWAGDPSWKISTPDAPLLNCDYRLIADNVLDATHTAYVHPTSIGASSLTQVDPHLTHDGEHVRLSRWILNCPPPPAYRDSAGFNVDTCDRWAAVEFRPPNYCVNFAGCVEAGYGGEKGNPAASPRRVEFVAISLPTPVTRNSCKYHYAFAWNFGHGIPAIDTFFNEGMVKVFEEDYPVLEAQQRLMELKPNAPQVTLITDRGPILARRMLERLVQGDRQKLASE